MQSRILLVIVLLGARQLHAQPDDRRDHRPGAPGPQVAVEPTVPPPPPHEEKEKTAARAGFVWIGGRWDWRNGKWEWHGGRWERERAGKQWRAGHWDARDKTWMFTEGAWVDGAQPPVTGDDRPHDAPPPPRDEKVEVRAGFVWIGGRWDWRDHKWAWVFGRWEPEHVGKQWRAARWEQRDGGWTLVDGAWIDQAGAAPPPTTERAIPSGDDGHDHHPREWKIDRPTVSSYWPSKGKIGTRVVIHGRNFPADAMIVWGSEPVKAAKVEPGNIVLQVPANATTGTIAIHREHGRDLVVGPFEVVASFDADADARRIDDEDRRRAEAAWTARQKELARDRTAREAAEAQRDQEMAANREQRRAQRVADLRAKWDQAFLGDPDAQSELTLHAQRIAELGRAKEVAETADNRKLVIRIDMATTREEQRHDQRMAALHDSFKTKGGAP